jgi:HD-like signal output (HDOD) protein
MEAIRCTKMTVDELIRDVEGLVSFPQVAVRVTQLVEDPQSSATDLGYVISQDPALALRVLQLANSSMYGMRHEVDTISRAVTILGTLQIRDMVLATSAIHSFDGIPNDLVSMEDFWRHSLFCGLAARHIASTVLGGREESSFIAGLLHNIGKLVIYSRMPEAATRTLMMILDGEERQRYQAERRVLGFDHAQVGGALLGQWSLPPHLIETTACHHEPEQAKNFPREAAMIHVANTVATMAQLDTSSVDDVPPMNEGSLALLGISYDHLPGIIQAIQQEIVDVEQVLFGSAAG